MLATFLGTFLPTTFFDWRTATSFYFCRRSPLFITLPPFIFMPAGTKRHIVDMLPRSRVHRHQNFYTSFCPRHTSKLILDSLMCRTRWCNTRLYNLPAGTKRHIVDMLPRSRVHRHQNFYTSFCPRHTSKLILDSLMCRTRWCNTRLYNLPM